MDRFSEKFHPRDQFIVAANRKRPLAMLLHDPNHKTIRARVWSTKGDFQQQIKDFRNELEIRIKTAIQKRSKSDVLKERDHFFLIFGEGDEIPGVLVHYIGGEILIQFYMDFWANYQDLFIQTIVKNVNHFLNKKITPKNIWVQKRSHTKEPAKCIDKNTSFKDIEVNEFGVKYKITLGKYYDHGIYTDMAAIRAKIKEQLRSSKSLLNLFSYTGAFSLFGLSLGLEDVVSVDLSKKYIHWLEENIALNEKLNKEHHTSMPVSTMSALNKFKSTEKTFDFIISDPPSSSSDGNKRSNALNDYKETLPLIQNLLNRNGYALLFINTHKVNMKKFEDRIMQIIENKKLKFKFENKFFLGEDCPNKKGFPEGSYLKGLLLKKI